MSLAEAVAEQQAQFAAARAELDRRAGILEQIGALVCELEAPDCEKTPPDCEKPTASARRTTAAVGRARSAPKPRQLPRETTGSVAERRAELVDAIRKHQPAAAGTLARVVGRQPEQLREDIHALRKDGTVVMEGSRGAARYSLAAPSQPRRRVPQSANELRQHTLSAVQQDPGALTDERLALAFDAPIGLVHAATSDLVAGELIAKQPDGTYIPA